MKTTVKHVGSVRGWEGPIRNWEAHSDKIEHWCSGGHVEFSNVRSGWVEASKKYPLGFDFDVECRIKQREPRPGEVWVIEHTAYLIHDLDGDIQSLNGKAYCCAGHTHLKYAAPSVETYYARKFWNKVYGNEGILNQPMADEAAYKMSDIIEEAAQLEKQQCNPGN